MVLLCRNVRENTERLRAPVRVAAALVVDEILMMLRLTKPIYSYVERDADE